MDDLDLRDGAPLWARVLWCIARRVAGLAWLGVRVLAAVWKVLLKMHNLVHSQQNAEATFVVACLLGVAFVARL